MPDTTSATLARHAADRLYQTHGTVGRPAVVATTQDEHGNMVLVYADGCLARRVPHVLDDAPFANGWQWVAMEGPDYDRLFCVAEARADD